MLFNTMTLNKAKYWLLPSTAEEAISSFFLLQSYVDDKLPMD